MVARASALSRPAPGVRSAPASLVVRLTFIVLLVACPLLPVFRNSVQSYPAVAHFWVVLPFCGLFLLPLIDFEHLRRMLHLDLLVLLSFAVALGTWSHARTWPMLFVYAPLAYLGVRMVRIARVGGHDSPGRSETPLALSLPRSWLIAGIVVLVGVHASWTLDSQVSTDVGPGSVQGAQRILHGRSLYGVDRSLLSSLGYDPHYDTYGPVDYEAYVPFAGVASSETAARLAALFFDLLTAALLLALGRQVRGPTVGIVLAYAWLAFPFTLYADGLAANDSMVAAALVGALLLAGAPLRRGAMAAVLAWTKLTPLALVPVLAGHNPSGKGRRRQLLAFGAAFGLASAVVFVPALTHGSPGEFMARTFGFQISRDPGYSIWERIDSGAPLGAVAGVRAVSGVAHGLLIALTGGFAVALLWLPKRQDVIGLAGASAAVLIAVLACDGYYSFTYILWFAPLVVVALVLESGEIAERRTRTVGSPAQEMTVSSLGSPVSTS
ncbi:MAG TPA: hypothetical protein VGH60_08765 [Solirubrobacteraceae bacterium]|jgi:hypothetical protein